MPDDKRVLEGVAKLMVDGTNVLHALRRTSAPLPPAALIGRLRAIVPAGVEVVVILDGSPEHGLVSRRVASGVEVRYAGRWTADEAIVGLAEHESAAGRSGLLVVTDDIDLAAAVRRAGGRTVRTGWLIDRLGRQRLSAPSAGGSSSPAPSIGSGGGGGGGGGGGIARAGGDARGGAGGDARSGASGGHSESDPDSADAPRWSPGRGATKKRGNGRRRPASGR